MGCRQQSSPLNWYRPWSRPITFIRGLHRVLLDEAPSSEEYRNPNSEFEIEYLSCYAEAVAIYRKRQPNAADRVAGRVISDAIDGVIHNAARRGAIDDLAMQGELARLIALYLGEPD